jgi:hypothetical protein
MKKNRGEPVQIWIEMGLTQGEGQCTRRGAPMTASTAHRILERGHSLHLRIPEPLRGLRE